MIGWEERRNLFLLSSGYMSTFNSSEIDAEMGTPILRRNRAVEHRVDISQRVQLRNNSGQAEGTEV